jgi:hypothetical protein
MRIARQIVVLILILFLRPMTAEVQQNNQLSQQGMNLWRQFEPGLEFGEFLAPLRSESGDSLIRILRIDPEYFALRLLNASSTSDHKSLTAKEWCQRYNLIAAINTSMYQTDYLTSVSLMRTKEHVNNPHLTKDKAILAFDRQSPNLPLVKIIDRQCENFDDWQKKYTSFVQSIRMISCKGRNVWRQQAQKWSTAVIATDRSDKVLFIHVRSRYTTHDLINILLELPLEISRAMYAEGGSEAQLYVKSTVYEYNLVGNHGSSGFNPYNGGRPIPNVIGIKRKFSVKKDDEKE